MALIKLKSLACKKCHVLTMYRKNGMCMDCYKDWLLNTEEGRKKLKRSTLRAHKEIQKEEKLKDKERKDRITNWGAKLQDEINHIVRLIDKNQPCLARGYTKYQMHAGHVWSRGGHSGCKYHLDNIHRQSAQSNKWQNDDHLLREGLKNEYGQEYYDFVDRLKNITIKYSNEDYRLFTIKAREIVKELVKADLVYSKEDRLRLRNEINFRLGIYK